MSKNKISFTMFGSSHADSVGVMLEGVGFGETIDTERLNAFLARRKASDNVWSTARHEPDEIVFESGVENGVTTGREIVAKIYNKDVKKGDYDQTRYLPRPSHADYVSFVKYGEDGERSGGGRFSGRMTAPMCIAGGIALQLLEKKGIKIGAYIQRIGCVEGKSYRGAYINEEEVLAASVKEFPLLDDGYKTAMLREIEGAASVGDSVGGVVECCCFGLPAGSGEPLTGSIESLVSANLFAIPAVKGVEFGSGFLLSSMHGNGANDEFAYENGRVITTTNHSGGINGGLANGMPVTIRVAFRPTPSVARKQNTVNLKTGENDAIAIRGRHDACFVPRAVPAVEAMTALAVINCI